MLYKRLKSKNIPENAVGSADVVKCFVYTPSYVDCLLARSGSTGLVVWKVGYWSVGLVGSDILNVL